MLKCQIVGILTFLSMIISCSVELSTNKVINIHRESYMSSHDELNYVNYQRAQEFGAILSYDTKKYFLIAFMMSRTQYNIYWVRDGVQGLHCVSCTIKYHTRRCYDLHYTTLLIVSITSGLSILILSLSIVLFKPDIQDLQMYRPKDSGFKS